MTVISMLTKETLSTPSATMAHNRAVANHKASRDQAPPITGWQNMGLGGFLDAYIDDQRLRACPIVDTIVDALTFPQQ